MKYKYKITDYSSLGLPSVEVNGDRFHYQDLFEMVGKHQYMSTFYLQKGSESYKKYGHSVLGVIYYDRNTLDNLKKATESQQAVEGTKLRIDSPRRELTTKARGDLKYSGISINDIERLSYLPYKEETEIFDTGEKKVPNLIELEVDFNDFDIDILNQNYLASKHNSDVELLQFEKEQLIGITLALNQGRIDSRILTEFGFTKETIKANLNIWMSYYSTKERRNQLTDDDKINYGEIKDTLSLEKLNKVLKELKHANISERQIESDKAIIKNIFNSVHNFSPSVLLHGQKQIYWNLDSYIHISLRHLKEYQLGNFSYKTPFPYKTNDLKKLIEKVLGKIGEEIEQYLTSDLTCDFKRHGKMAIHFNGDYYHLIINREGCLTQFHMTK